MREMKIAAAARAVDFVRPGMKLGIGTGSTAEEFIRLLAERVAQGLDIIGVATSKRSEVLCEELHIPLASLEQCSCLDLVIDGADEIGSDLSLIKGGGGALLYEKIVAQAADEMLVIADESKLVEHLGAFPLAVEINIFGALATLKAIERVLQQLGLEGQIHPRKLLDKNFVTDGGHYIVDLTLGTIPDPHALSAGLLNIAGVVEHGLFLGMAATAVIATPSGEIKIIHKDATHSH